MALEGVGKTMACVINGQTGNVGLHGGVGQFQGKHGILHLVIRTGLAEMG